MEAPVAVSFGVVHFGAVKLGDRRRERRLVGVADELVRHPDGTWPGEVAQTCGSQGDVSAHGR